jgi:hypothetical protein
VLRQNTKTWIAGSNRIRPVAASAPLRKSERDRFNLKRLRFKQRHVEEDLDTMV